MGRMAEKSSMKMRKNLSSASNAGGHGRSKDDVVDEMICMAVTPMRHLILRR